HRDQAATCLNIGLSVPDRDAERFLALARERLEHTTLPAPTLALQLSADRFAMPMALHADLLSGAVRQREEFAHTLDRIAARLGEQQVHALRSRPDHRPESSWAVVHNSTTQPAAVDKRPAPEFPDRPLWLLPQPQPLCGLPHLTSHPTPH